jgi:hypothetical protein
MFEPLIHGVPNPCEEAKEGYSLQGNEERGGPRRSRGNHRARPCARRGRHGDEHASDLAGTMAEHVYSKGTRVWFVDKEQAWISAEVTNVTKGAGDAITLVFTDERGKVSHSGS